MGKNPDKPNLDFAIICDDVRIEEQNKISLMGLFGTIFADKTPATHPKFAVVTTWVGAAGTFKVEINIVSPDGKHSERIVTTSFKLLDEKKPQRTLTFVHNWKAPTFGTYEVQIVLDGKIVRSLPLMVSPTHEASGSEG